MGILDDIRADAKMIVTDESEFNLPCVFNDGTNPVIEANALFIRRTDALLYDDGSKKNAPFSSLTTDIDLFNFTGDYVSLKNWTVTVEDKTYKIVESLPNRTLGIIQCNLLDE